MSTLHPKFTVSVYQPGMTFNQEPYDVSRGFGIYTLKKEEPSGLTLSEKFKMSTATSGWNSPPVKSFNPPETSQANLVPPEETFSRPKAQALQAPSLNPDWQRIWELANELNKEEEEREAVNSRGRPAEIEVGDEQQYFGKSTVSIPANYTLGYTPRTTRSRSQLGSTQKSFLKMRTKTSQLRHTLYYDQRINSIPKTALKNKVIEDIIEKEDDILRNPVLLESIIKLRDMKLLKQNSPSTTRYKGVGKVDYVYNDFHSRSTNPGYSRNTAGVFYFR